MASSSKRSASLLLLLIFALYTGSRLLPKVGRTKITRSSAMNRASDKDQYRPSASVLIVAKTPEPKDKYNYQVLLIKRTAPTAYAPDHCVFPGGVFEEAADESLAWLQYMNDFGVTQQQIAQLQPAQRPGVRRPTPLLTSGRNFSRDISLRITALRETFEEVGVLLCRDKSALHSDNAAFGRVCQDFDRVHWQRAVHDDPQQFYRLCRTLQVVPDLWCLHEWSAWRSPRTASKKFETVFYVAALERQPHLLLEPSEVELALWNSPTTFLQLFSQRNIWLPPIQVYELSRLTNAHWWAQLLSFAQARGTQGVTMLMPAYYRCTDGLVGTLPEDDCYPADPLSPIENNALDCSVEEFCQRTVRQHRILIRDMHNATVRTNIPPIDGHLSAVAISKQTRICKL